MDKFGVFNLLNSLFALNGKNSATTNQNQQSFNLDKLLNSLLPKKEQNSSQETTKQPEIKQFAPLQASMLATMHSHEQFVKRVKEKNKV